MLSFFKASRKTHWRDSFEWLAYTLILGALPFWGVALVTWLLRLNLNPIFLVEHAELAVYSAGLLASALPVMTRDVRQSDLRTPRIFIVIAILLIACAALLFGLVSSGVFASQFLDSSSTVANSSSAASPQRWNRLLGVSIGITAISVILCFCTDLFNNVRLDPDIAAMKNQEVADLNRSVSALVGGGHGKV